MNSPSVSSKPLCGGLDGVFASSVRSGVAEQPTILAPTCPTLTRLSRCAVLKLGFYAAAMQPGSSTITATGVCPQGYLCGGGRPRSTFNPADPTALRASETTIVRCPDGMWTKDVGATASQQCRECVCSDCHTCDSC